MPDQALYDEISRFFTDRLNVATPPIDDDLFETGTLDSLTFVDLVLFLEEQFDIHVSPDELEIDNFCSRRKIAAFVAAHRSLNKVGAA